jgi:AMP-polyphosphate phosphotransferase
MKAKEFVVHKRPDLRAVKHGTMANLAYESALERKQQKMQQIQQAFFGSHERAVILLEGWDTAGKGGFIRRLAWALDPRGLKVYPIAAPTAEERAKHYLQRFWERLPAHGQIVVFDRSWYGRVLVERIEGFAAEKEWKRAYREINDFERLLADDGIRLVKLFLHITPDEQLNRLQDRVSDPLKRWKLSFDDFRNRARWSDYEEAIADMMAETSTKRAPWHLIPSNDKQFARIAAFQVLSKRLSEGIDLSPRPLDSGIQALVDEVIGKKARPELL